MVLEQKEVSKGFKLSTPGPSLQGSTHSSPARYLFTSPQLPFINSEEATQTLPLSQHMPPLPPLPPPFFFFFFFFFKLQHPQHMETPPGGPGLNPSSQLQPTAQLQQLQQLEIL